MSRRARRWTLLFLVVLVLGGMAWLLWPVSKITAANAERIKVGMTLEEVEAILGGHGPFEAGLLWEGGPLDGMPDDRIVLCYGDEWGDLYVSSFEDASLRHVWVSRSARIEVKFGEDNRVMKVNCMPVQLFTCSRSSLDRWRAFIEKKLGRNPL